jgi:sortase A
LLRWLEIALCILGVSLLGVALEDTWSRWNYQAQQERALERGPAVSVAVAPVLATPDKAPSVERVTPSTRRIEKKRSSAAADPTALGRIEIPRLGVAAIVEEGADQGTLARAVGLVPGSARPGEPGNMVLAGHRDTFFRPLRRIKVNDRIRMIVPPHTYEYRVQSLRVVTPEETSVLDSNGVEELTLVTCYPFRFVGPAPERFIVSATRVN